MGLTETRIMVMLLDGENNNPGANHEKTLSQLQTHPYQSRQIVAFHVGDRSGQSAEALWKSIPEWYRQHATFYTDGWCAYEGVIPDHQHRVVNKQRRITNHIERFNCTVRQRVSRLVRKSLSFSKKLANHIGAIKYFICHYNLEKALRV